MWLGAALAGVAALVVVFMQAGATSSVGAAAPTATLSCDASALTYGESVHCEARASVDAELQWGDGTTGGLGAATHTPQTVGALDVQVIADGLVLASHTVTVTPDLAIDCDFGLPKGVYELTPAAEGAFLPYDYVYLADDGSKIFHGDPDYPQTLRAAMDMTPSILAEEPIVGLCRTVSSALEDLGGSATWTVEDGWYPPRVFHSRNVVPGTQGDWEGVQPIDVTLTVDVDGYEASERIGVYFGGCG